MAHQPPVLASNAGGAVPNSFDPSTGTAGVYTYSVTAAGCPDVTSELTIAITPEPNSGTDASISRCESTGNIDLTAELGGTPATGGVWTDATNAVIANPYNISGQCGNTLALTYTVSSGTCTSSSTLNLSIDCTPNAGGDGTLTTCADGAPISLTTGLIGAFDTPGTWVDGSGVAVPDPTAVSPASLGTGETFTYTVTGNSCASATADVTVTVTPSLTTNALTASCTPSQTTYIVTFAVQGGDAGSLNVTGGALAGTTFTSNPIAVGTPYSFTVSDGSACADITVTGASPNCSCPATASFITTNQTICLGETVDLALDLQGVAPFSVDYSAGGLPAGTVSTSPISVSPAFTTTYVLTGMSDNNCVGSASGSVTITVEQPVSAGSDITDDYCGDGSSLNLTTILDPAASTSGVFSANPINLVPANDGNVYTYTVTGTECPSDVANYTINIDAPLAFTNLQVSCEPNQSQYTVSATISGGNPPYTSNAGTVTGTTFNSGLLDIATTPTFSFSITDNGPCGALAIGGNAPNCSCPVTAAFEGGNQTICIGSSTSLILDLNGGTDGQYSVSYTENGTLVGPLNNLSDGDIITVSPTANTNYVLTVASDNNCTGTANGSINVNVEQLANAGIGANLSYCGDGQQIILSPEPSATTGGTFTPSASFAATAANAGAYTYTVSGSACPDDAATYNVGIIENLAVSDLTAVCEPNQTEYTVCFTITGGTPPYLVNGVPSGADFCSTLDFAANPNFDFVISDSGICSDVSVSQIAPDCNCIAQGSISGTTAICLGGCTNITFNMIGDAPFNMGLQNSNDGTITTFTGEQNGYNHLVCPTVTTTYTLVTISDQYCDGVVTGTPVTVTVNPAILVTNATPICDNTAENYQVEFNVSGGVPPFTFAPAGGTFDAITGVYTSGFIPSGNGYTISVNDAGACPAVEISSASYACDCISDAGTIATAPLEVCIGESLDVAGNGDETLDGNDILQYVLHDGGVGTIGNIIDRSIEGNFVFDYSQISGESNLFINVVVGNADLAGNVDLNDDCTDLSAGIPLTVRELPTATISGAASVCSGEAVDLTVEFTGTGSWDFTYAINGDVQPDQFSSAQSYTITTTQVGTYTIESVSDSFCAGSGFGQAVVQNFLTPTATLSGSPAICAGTGDGPSISFTGNGPWSFVYSLNGDEQDQLSSNSSTYTIIAEEDGLYELISVEDANCNGTVSGSLDVTLLEAPTATISGGGTVCAGEQATFNVDLTGNGPWTVQYTVDGFPQSPLTSNSSAYNFESGVDGDYVIVSVNDDNCSGEVLASQAALNVNPIPTAEIQTASSVFCIGQEVEVGIDLEGVPPFSLVYILNSDTVTVNGIQGDFIQTFTPTEALSLEVVSIRDGSNPTCSANPLEFTFIDAVELQNAPILTSDTTCSDVGPVNIGVNAAPGLTYSWSPTTNLSDASLANPVFTISEPSPFAKNFTYVLTASNGLCSAKDTMTLRVDPGPNASFRFSPDPINSEDPLVFFDNTSFAGMNAIYLWEFDSLGTSDKFEPSFKFPDGINDTYQVDLTAFDPVTGCIDTFSEVINVRPQTLIYVPNAFTPDGNGLNDLWGPVLTNIDPTEYRLTVFNRMGEIVFVTSDIKQKWNGSFRGNDFYAEPGVYVWQIETKNEVSLEDIKLEGQVTLVR